jgi:hypothetical protein
MSGGGGEDEDEDEDEDAEAEAGVTEPKALELAGGEAGEAGEADDDAPASSNAAESGYGADPNRSEDGACGGRRDAEDAEDGEDAAALGGGMIGSTAEQNAHRVIRLDRD